MKIVAAALIGLFIGFLTINPVAVQAQTAEEAICAGLQQASGSGCGDDDAGGTVNNIVVTVINVLSLIGGVIAVIMIIVAGLRYMTANGDTGSLTTARNTIIYAVIGLVVIALAQIIVRFTVDRVTTATEG